MVLLIHAKEKATATIEAGIVRQRNIAVLQDKQMCIRKQRSQTILGPKPKAFPTREARDHPNLQPFLLHLETLPHLSRQRKFNQKDQAGTIPRMHRAKTSTSAALLEGKVSESTWPRLRPCFMTSNNRVASMIFSLLITTRHSRLHAL
jgi:hypothetical protein